MDENYSIWELDVRIAAQTVRKHHIQLANVCVGLQNVPEQQLIMEHLVNDGNILLICVRLFPKPVASWSNFLHLLMLYLFDNQDQIEGL